MVNDGLGVLAHRENDRQFRVEVHCGHRHAVRLYRRQTLLGLVVPNLDSLIVRTSREVRLVSLVKINRIHRTLMPRDSHIGLTVCGQIPQLDRLVHRTRSELAEIFGIECQSKDEVLVLLKSASQRKIFLVVPKLDLGVVRTTDDQGLGGMDQNRPYEVGMRINALHLLGSVIVKHPDLEVIGPTEHPVLLGEKLHSPYWVCRGLECANRCLCGKGGTLLE